jgi:DNA mismatch endonuclease (patch repair protein)
MTDRITPENRSRNMAAIRGKNTVPEVTVRRFLHAQGFRFRLHHKDLPGKPDIVLPKYRTAIFVHGCFWHLHGCKNTVIPKTRTEWWLAKLEGNRTRDEKNSQRLKQLGWRVITIWECEISNSRLSDFCRQIAAPSALSRRRKPRKKPEA